MNLKSQDSMTTATIFIGGTLGLWCRCCGKPLDIMTLGNFPVNNWVSHKKKCGRLRWSVQLKYSCLFKHDTGGAALQCISHRDVLKCQKTSRCFVSASLALSCKRTHQWIIKRSPRHLCLFEVAAEKCQENYCKQGWRVVVGGGLKESRGKQKHMLRRASAAQLAHGGTVLIPRISSAWHLLASTGNDCRWRVKANDLMLTFFLPLWISIR